LIQYVKTDCKNVRRLLPYSVNMDPNKHNKMQELIKKAKEAAAAKAEKAKSGGNPPKPKPVN
jgi:hypothetical protein